MIRKFFINADLIILPAIKPIFLWVGIISIWFFPIGTIIGVFSLIIWLGIGQQIKEMEEASHKERLETSDFGKKIIAKKNENIQKVQQETEDKKELQIIEQEQFLTEHSQEIRFLGSLEKEILEGVGYIYCERFFLGSGRHLTLNFNVIDRKTLVNVITLNLENSGSFGTVTHVNGETKFQQFENHQDIEQFCIEKLSKYYL